MHFLLPLKFFFHPSEKHLLSFYSLDSYICVANSVKETYLCVKKNTLDPVKTLFTPKPVMLLKNLWSWCVKLNFPTQHVQLTKPIISQLEVWFFRTIEHWAFQGAAITETIVLNNFGLMVCEHQPSQLPLSYFGWNLTVHRVMLGIL